MYLFAAAIGGDGISEAQAVPKGLAFHPCAPGLIASRGLRKVSLCDLTSPQGPCLSIGGSSAFEGVREEKRREERVEMRKGAGEGQREERQTNGLRNATSCEHGDLREPLAVCGVKPHSTVRGPF